MAVLYRSERKKILYSQLHLIEKIQTFLEKAEEAYKTSGKAYQSLIMDLTAQETKEKEDLKGNEKALRTWEELYYWRRL